MSRARVKSTLIAASLAAFVVTTTAQTLVGEVTATAASTLLTLCAPGICSSPTGMIRPPGPREMVVPPTSGRVANPSATIPETAITAA